MPRRHLVRVRVRGRARARGRARVRVRVRGRGRGRGYLGLDERVGAVFEQHLHKLPG